MHQGWDGLPDTRNPDFFSTRNPTFFMKFYYIKGRFSALWPSKIRKIFACGADKGGNLIVYNEEMLQNLHTIFQDQEGLCRYLWEVSGMDPLPRSAFIRIPLFQPSASAFRFLNLFPFLLNLFHFFHVIFYHKKNSGLMAFQNLQNFCLRRQKSKKTVNE